MFNSIKTLILLILCFSNYFIFCQESVHTVNIDNFPPLLTLFNGSTILFVVGLNTGDHIIFTKVTPKGVQPFTSPVLNLRRLQPSFSYTFSDAGKYVIMDMYTSEEMNLTIIDTLSPLSSSSSSSDSTNNQSKSSSSNSVNASSSSTKPPISSLETDSLNNSTSTTTTTSKSSHEKNESIQLLSSFSNLIFISIILLSL
ncbi:hypothetical protein DDB_G0277769 [Dictyostelium discoideum AX4]|uniref:Uncharacterized protein n=1 Tax=Dictyostelium discoideum TaxID=44689 RepID=Q54Z78_DICDI|nr:hypothetical protein DDB_G0277769 [Dictyostelium discoideum AX4]EAL68558.1 hypothetical protein DDB_G0277769 [Dictyostelium discoideum AX4]|eukprot:XP_642475.1 hypothetical protein DDB_G0277769 [Dictyostelium discoideum AX4]